MNNNNEIYNNPRTYYGIGHLNSILTEEKDKYPQPYYGIGTREKDKYWTREEITPYTPEMMLDLIKKETGRDDIALPGGMNIMLKLYTNLQEESDNPFQMSDKVSENESRYNTRIGKVLAFGPAAFLEKKIFLTGPTCLIGHYAMFNKYQNQNYTIVNYDEDKNIEIGLIPDHKILGCVYNPSIIDSARIMGR